MVAARFKDVQEAGEVAVEVRGGVGDGVAHPSLGGEVDHKAEAMEGKELIESSRIGDIELLEGEGGVYELAESRFLEGDGVVVVEVVDADDLMSLGEQGFGEVETDEAGTSGDQDGGVFLHGDSVLHRRSLWNKKGTPYVGSLQVGV